MGYVILKNGSWNVEETVRAEQSRSMNGFFGVVQIRVTLLPDQGKKPRVCRVVEAS